MIKYMNGLELVDTDDVLVSESVTLYPTVILITVDSGM